MTTSLQKSIPTKILTNKGLVPVEEVKKGDVVVSIENGFRVENTVEEVEKTECIGNSFKVNGEIVLASNQSIFANGNVTHAKLLKVGDTLVDLEGKSFQVETIEEIEQKYWYKFQIDGNHGYFANGILLHNASRFWVLDTGTWDNADTTHWSATSGGLGGASVPVDGDTVTFDASSCLLSGTVTLGYSPTVTSITCGALTGTLDFNTRNPTMDTFSYSGTGVRTIAFGSGTWTIRGSGTTVWSGGTTTNLTLTGTITINCTYSGGTGSRTISTGTSVFANTSSVMNITAGTDTITTANSTPGFYTLNFTGFSGTWVNGSATTYSFKNSLIMSATMTNNVTSAITFNGTAGTGTFTPNGIQFASAITFSGVGGTWQLGSNLVNTSSITLTNGTFTAVNGASNYNVTCTLFSSSNANTRVLTMGSGTWTLTGSGATIWTTSTNTGLTLTAGASIVNCTYSGGTGTRAISMGAGDSLNTLKVSAGTDIFNFGRITCVDLDFTGFSGENDLVTATSTINGNIIFSATMTFGGSQVYTFSATSSKTITTNGVTIDRSVTLSGVGGIWVLQDNFTMGSTRTFSLSNGTINSNNKNVSVGLFSSSNSNTRTITLGSGTWTLTGTGTVWTTATTTNLTLTANTATIKLTDSSASTKTFSGGGLTFYYIWLAPGVGAGEFDFVGSNTFTSFLDDGTVAHAIKFTAGTTTTFTNKPDFSGASVANITISSITAATHTLVFSGTTPISFDFLTISYSIASPNTVWYAGANSVDSGNNTGWVFGEYHVDIDRTKIERFDQDRFAEYRFAQNRFF